ncbi:hypothetical protein [Kamptonema formosum]|nr:hypothetical protein [Oscillatoria sp. PCC 10802]
MKPAGVAISIESHLSPARSSLPTVAENSPALTSPLVAAGAITTK